ncbi:MAG: lysyl oxidase family protein [Gemmatimonadales bacterium]
MGGGETHGMGAVGRVMRAALVAALLATMTAPGLAQSSQSAALLPDLLTVVPGALTVRGRQAGAHLWFTNAIANVGQGVLQIRGVTVGGTTYAYQELLNAAGQIIGSIPAGSFEFHPDHNHWHIDAVSAYTLRAGALNGPVVSEQSKVTFCLIDVEKVFPAHQGGPQHYKECNADLQGITNGWADEYVRGLPGQQLPLGAAQAGIYYLVSTSDPLNRFVEVNENDNTAWVKFELTYVNGAPKVHILESSPCEGVFCSHGP